MMIEATLKDIRNSTTFFKNDEIIHIVDGRKKEEIGFFIPKVFAKEFQKFIDNIEKRKKIELLKRVASAQKKDLVGDGTVFDGIK